MSLRRVLGWIWAIVGRVLLYGTACLVIAFLFVRQEWEQRGRSWQGRGRGGGGWRGDREPAERVIPAVNHAYDEALRQQKSNTRFRYAWWMASPWMPLVNHLITISRACWFAFAARIVWWFFAGNPCIIPSHFSRRP